MNGAFPPPEGSEPLQVFLRSLAIPPYLLHSGILGAV